MPISYAHMASLPTSKHTLSHHSLPHTHTLCNSCILYKWSAIFQPYDWSGAAYLMSLKETSFNSSQRIILRLLWTLCYQFMLIYQQKYITPGSLTDWTLEITAAVWTESEWGYTQHYNEPYLKNWKYSLERLHFTTFFLDLGYTDLDQLKLTLVMFGLS